MTNKTKIVDEQELLNALTDTTAHTVNFIRCMYWPQEVHHKINSLALPHHLLIFVERGKILLKLNETLETINAGSILLLSPGVVRDMWIPTGTVVSNYRLHFSLMEGNKQLRLNDPYYILGNCYPLLPFFVRLNYLHRFPGRFSKFSIRATLLDLFATFFDIYIHQKSTRNRGLNTVQCSEIEDYLRLSINKSIHPVDLAKKVGLSPDYFTRLFTKTYGVSPRTYIKQQRLQEAAIMLQENSLRINEIAKLCGCHNTQLFNRQFKEQFHCTPKQYRSKNSY